MEMAYSILYSVSSRFLRFCSGHLWLCLLFPGPSEVCPASRCCRAGDDHSLLKHATHTIASGMRTAVSGSLYELRRLSSRLSGESLTNCQMEHSCT